jgi:nicotinic acid mononucleotide adenylyltransferase
MVCPQDLITFPKWQQWQQFCTEITIFVIIKSKPPMEAE